MEDFYRYTRNIEYDRYRDWHSYNEILELTYLIMGFIFRQGSDELRVTKTQILSSKNGVATEYMDIAEHEQQCEQAKAQGKGHDYCLSFREAVRLIYEHDERVRQHYELVDDVPDACTYRIIK